MARGPWPVEDSLKTESVRNSSAFVGRGGRENVFLSSSLQPTSMSEYFPLTLQIPTILGRLPGGGKKNVNEVFNASLIHEYLRARAGGKEDGPFRCWRPTSSSPAGYRPHLPGREDFHASCLVTFDWNGWRTWFWKILCSYHGGRILGKISSEFWFPSLKNFVNRHSFVSGGGGGSRAERMRFINLGINPGGLHGVEMFGLKLWMKGQKRFFGKRERKQLDELYQWSPNLLGAKRSWIKPLWHSRSSPDK